MMRSSLSSRFAVAVIAFWALAGSLGHAWAQDAAEILLRLDRLEAENRRLNGQIEEMRFANRRLEDQLKRFQNDADLRMRDLEAGRGGAARPAAPAPQGQAPARRSDAFDPERSPGASGAPQQLGSAPAGGAPSGGAPLQLPGGALPAPNPPPPVAAPQVGLAPAVPAAPPGQNAKADFDFARDLFRRGDFELSEAAFRDFLRNHKRDRRVPEATFWLGESYFNRTRYREAAEHYLTVTTKYSNAARAPEAMLKLGMSLRGLGANAEACGTFEQVARKYPKAPANVKAAAERERARSKC